MQTLLPFAFYFDLRCPFCFVASERLQHLGDRPPIAYRSVRHERDLPSPARELTLAEREFVEKELVALEERAPELRLTMPTLWPSTELVARSVAAITRTGRGDPGTFVAAMYRALWQEGRDPSMTLVVAEALREAGATGRPVARTTPRCDAGRQTGRASSSEHPPSCPRPASHWWACRPRAGSRPSSGPAVSATARTTRADPTSRTPVTRAWNVSA